MLTGWKYAKDGKKSTTFSSICKALGVEFDFSRSEHKILQVANTESRRMELMEQLKEALQKGKLSKPECLVLRGRLGFADSFLHGRIGKLTLKRLIDHAYGRSSVMGEDLKQALKAMSLRLEHSKPNCVAVDSFTQLFVYTDASFEPSTCCGGLGAVLVDAKSHVLA